MISLLFINNLLPNYNIYKTRENLNKFTTQIQNTTVENIGMLFIQLKVKTTLQLRIRQLISQKML